MVRAQLYPRANKPSEERDQVSTPKHDQSGPAFPISQTNYHPGMTLRDYFAGQALTGWICGTRDPEATSWEPRWWAREAYKTADAMLAERNKTT